MIWEVSLKNKDSDIDPELHIYQIKDIFEDTTYSDFGFAVLKFTTINEQNVETKYELLSIMLGEYGQLLLIDNDKIGKTKIRLAVIN